MAELTDKELKAHVAALVPKVDLQTTGLKQFVKQLSKNLGMDLKPRKAFIKEALTEEIERLKEQEESESEEEEEENDDDDETEEEESDEEPAPKAKKSSSKKGGGGLAQKKEISDKLANFLGRGKTMARTEIVKALWEYIRQHELQNPKNKREIFLDDAMKDVFGCDTFTMFTMNKYVGEHVYPFNKIDWSKSPTPKKKRKAPRSASTDKKKRKTGTQPPYRLSEQLAEVVGATILPRPQVVSHVWKYIKANDLQNPEDKREILCDDKLKAIMGEDRVSMFKMNQLITPHLVEKVDRSLYQVEEDDDDSEEE